MPKIYARNALVKIIAGLRKKGEKIVFANGCFDLVHVGHVRFLRGARKKGDRLVVGIISDSSVRELKGPGRPLVNEKKRAAVVAAFEFVDFVVIFSEPDVRKTLEILRPTHHARALTIPLILFLNGSFQKNWV